MATKTILIVDDDLQLAQLLQAVFAKAGYQSRIAKHGAAAFLDLDTAPADLILADVFMPVIDGITFCHLVRARPASRTTPIIVMSAATLEQPLPISFASFLAKPFEPQELLALVASLIGAPAGREDGHA